MSIWKTHNVKKTLMNARVRRKLVARAVSVRRNPNGLEALPDIVVV